MFLVVYQTPSKGRYNLFLLKNKNLIYGSKIIFKHVNSIIKPIFNEKIIINEVCKPNKQYIIHRRIVNNFGLKKKKKKET